MPELNDEELNALLSSLSPPEPPEGLSQRIMAAIPATSATDAPRSFLDRLLGARGFALPASGALASLLFGVSIGYLALPDLATDVSDPEGQYLEAVADGGWESSLEDLF